MAFGPFFLLAISQRTVQVPDGNIRATHVQCYAVFALLCIHVGGLVMSVAKVIELTSTSTKSFEDAIQKGIARADKTLKNVEGAWIKEQKVVVTDGKITAYRINMLVTFVLGGDTSV